METTSPRDREPFPLADVATAYHEAGHAVMALALGRPIQRVSVQANERRLGHCEIGKGAFRPSDDLLETELLILLAGLAAEAMKTGEYAWDGAAQDLRDVRRLAEMRASGQRQVERLERRLLDKAEHMLQQPALWLAVQKIAAELLRSPTISGRAAHHFFNQAAAEAKK